MNDTIHRKIQDYFNGQLSAAEEAEIIEWLKLTEANRVYFQQIKADLDPKNMTHPLLETSYTELQNRLFINQQFNSKFSGNSRKIHLSLLQFAAILLLPLLLLGGLIFSYLPKKSDSISTQIASSVIYAPMGSRVSFVLPDGTKGWLNSGSSLAYSIPFENRFVSLDGEAWFDVTHNQNHPFEISAGASKVKVLGTSFNVSAYQETQYVEVVLQQGKVDFYRDSLAEKITIAPSQKLVYSSGKVNVSMTDASKYEAWTEGKLVFRGDNMAEVARRIERWYNVKVILADQDLEKYSFRATFEDDSLEDVLRLLSMTSPISYKITPRTLHLDGTIAKFIVTLNKRVSMEKIKPKE